MNLALFLIDRLHPLHPVEARLRIVLAEVVDLVHVAGDEGLASEEFLGAWIVCLKDFLVRYVFQSHRW